MKVIGLIGGMSWASSAQYDAIINECVSERLGGMHSARSLMLSVDFADIGALQHIGDWAALADQMTAAARQLEHILICTNTMQRVADEVEAAVNIPLLHIADASALRVAAAGHRRAGLLGTAFTMELDFYKRRLADRFGLDVIVPDTADRAAVHAIIYNKLVVGQVLAASRARYREIIARLIERGAEAIILGCTEIILLVEQSDSAVALFDTTRIHAETAVDFALR